MLGLEGQEVLDAFNLPLLLEELQMDLCPRKDD